MTLSPSIPTVFTDNLNDRKFVQIIMRSFENSVEMHDENCKQLIDSFSLLGEIHDFILRSFYNNPNVDELHLRIYLISSEYGPEHRSAAAYKLSWMGTEGIRAVKVPNANLEKENAGYNTFPPGIEQEFIVPLDANQRRFFVERHPHIMNKPLPSAAPVEAPVFDVKIETQPTTTTKEVVPMTTTNNNQPVQPAVSPVLEQQIALFNQTQQLVLGMTQQFAAMQQQMMAVLEAVKAPVSAPQPVVDIKATVDPTPVVTTPVDPVVPPVTTPPVSPIEVSDSELDAKVAALKEELVAAGIDPSDKDKVLGYVLSKNPEYMGLLDNLSKEATVSTAWVSIHFNKMINSGNELAKNVVDHLKAHFNNDYTKISNFIRTEITDRLKVTYTKSGIREGLNVTGDVLYTVGDGLEMTFDMFGALINTMFQLMGDTVGGALRIAGDGAYHLGQATPERKADNKLAGLLPKQEEKKATPAQA